MELGIFERQLRLMVLLTQNREYSLDELCRKLDMSRRTLYRYLELFRDIGFEVVKQGNVYRLDKSSPFFKEITQLVHFTEDEALKLIRAEAYDKRLVVMTQAQFETVFRSWMKPGEGQ